MAPIDRVRLPKVHISRVKQYLKIADSAKSLNYFIWFVGNDTLQNIKEKNIDLDSSISNLGEDTDESGRLFIGTTP